MPWGIKQDFLSQGALGRTVGWWLQSFLKLSTLSPTRDLTWDWTSAWRIYPDRRQTPECLTMVSTEWFLSPSLPLFGTFYFIFVWWKRGKKEDGGYIFITKTYFLLCLHFLLHKNRLWEKFRLGQRKDGSCFLFVRLMTPCFPICSDWTETEARAWLTAVASSGSHSVINVVFLWAT